ncbi:MAG TPA: class A beta-lactamase [Longimicrobium sp.]
MLRHPLLHGCLLAAAALICSAPAAAQCPAATPSPDATEQLLRAVRARETEIGGRIGFHARHLESGASAGLHAGEPFFMSSVTKLPIAVRVLRQAGRGRIRLSDTVAIAAAEMSPGHSPLREAHPAGVSLTVEDLLRRAVSQSDNTASDALLRLAGGADSVTAELRRLGFPGVRVDRPYTRLGREVGGRIAAGEERDSMTPGTATALLAALHGGRLLAPRESALLLGWMTRTANPATRIVAGVPEGTVVAHKTGTWGQPGERGPAAVNDVGIVTLPGGAGHLAVAIFVRNAAAPDTAVERAIAAITREAYCHWAAAPTSAARR